MTPASFVRMLFFPLTCLRNGVTGVLLACVILLRQARHGALVNKGDAIVEGLTRRGRVSASKPIGDPPKCLNASRATDILESSSEQLPIGRIGTLTECSTPEP